MYHVAMGVSDDGQHLTDKIEMVENLPSAAESVRVTLVHVDDDDGAPDDVSTVSSAREALSAAGIEVETRRAQTDDLTEGLRVVVDELDVDLLCLGGRRRTPAGKRQLKPGAQEVMLQTDCPVVVAGELEGRGPRT